LVTIFNTRQSTQIYTRIPEAGSGPFSLTTIFKLNP
jgi:hypothetical protein